MSESFSNIIIHEINEIWNSTLSPEEKREKFKDLRNKYFKIYDGYEYFSKNNYNDNYNNNIYNYIYNRNNDYYNSYFKKIKNSNRSKPFGAGFYILVAAFIFILISICCARCRKSKKNKSEIVTQYAPVVVTSSTHVPPNAGVNYPVDEPVRGYQTAHTPYSQPSYPMPQPAPVHTGVPYPINNTGMPMPQTNTPYPPAQPVGYQAPYPPAQNPQDVLPPSYDQVVGTTGPASAPYNKQAPYNPHYTGN